MGIKRFHKFFATGISSIYTRKRKLSDDKEVKTLGDFFGKFCVVDVYSKLYSGIISIRSKIKELKNTTIIDNSHLHVILNNTIFLLRIGLIPIYVFDGHSPNIKSETIAKRRNIQEKTIEKMSKIAIEDQNEKNPEYIKIFKRNFKITNKQIDECKELLSIMGIPFIQSLEEADIECVKIMKMLGDKCAFIISDDTDHLVLGGKRMISNFTKHIDKTNYFDLEKIYEIFTSKINKIRIDFGKEPIKEISYENFAKFMIIMGTDYNRGIKTKNIDDLMTDFVLSDFDINKMIILLKEKGIIIPKSFIDNWEKSLKFYCYEDIEKKYEISFKKYDSEKFVKILKKLQTPKRKIDSLCKDLTIAYYILTKI